MPSLLCASLSTFHPTPPPSLDLFLHPYNIHFTSPYLPTSHQPPNNLPSPLSPLLPSVPRCATDIKSSKSLPPQILLYPLESTKQLHRNSLKPQIQIPNPNLKPQSQTHLLPQ